MKTRRAPSHLRKPTRVWWRTVCTDYDLDDHHVRLLTLSCEAWDECQAALEILAVEGLTYDDRFGAPRSRPEVSVERDARLAFSRLVRELDLDTEQVSELSRPPALRSNRR